MINRIGFLCVLAIALCVTGVGASESDRGFLDKPPLFVNNYEYFPLADMGIDMPKAGATAPDIDLTSLESYGFRAAGNNVQPSLAVTLNSIRVGAIHGFSADWAAGFWIPWKRTAVRGSLGEFSGNATVEGMGNLAFFGKHTIKRDGGGGRVVVTAGFELPTGLDTATFDQSNSATNGYYQGFPRRLPTGWQPSSGTFNGYLGIAYGKRRQRLSFEGIVAAMMHSSGDEGVKVGDIFVAAATGTYGISKKIAGSLGLTLQTQGDDSYPQSPGVNQSPLIGTTTHGTALYLEPAIRYNLRGIDLGLGLQYPLVRPQDGLVPRTLVFYIVSPAGW